ncbi:MAG: GumC family protein [Kiloniellales bacterium]
MTAVEPLPPPARPFRSHESFEGRPTPLHRRVVEQIDIRELIRKLLRQKYVIIATTVAITAIAGLVIWNLTPRYSASAYVMLEPRTTQVVDIQAVLSGLGASEEDIQTQIRVIQSRTLAEKTIAALELDRDPEFNPTLRLSSTEGLFNWGAYVAYLPESWHEALGLTEEPEPVLPEPIEDERLANGLIAALLNNLSVSPEGTSRVIQITFESENPRTAAKVANTVADFYIVAQLDAKFEATKRANEWLSERIAELGAQVEAADKKAEAYRARFGLVQGTDAMLAQQEVSEVSSQLVQERAKRAEAVARLSQVQSLLTSDGGVTSASEVLSSPTIQSLRQQETEIERRIAELSQEFGDRHPQMINTRAELADLQGRIKIEVDRIVQSLRNEVAVARAREASLEQALDERTGKLAEVRTAEVELRALERESEAGRALLETFLARSKETRSQEDFQQADATILSSAPIPNSPSYPKKKLMLAVAMLGAAGLGVILAFLIEQLDQGFRSTEQIERVLGMKTLGLVPAMPVSAKLRHKPHQYILSRPRSAYAEAIRSLYTSLLLSDSTDDRTKVIMITSALPAEGKSATALSLAILQAKVGQQVVIVDCDLRRPSVHKTLGLPSRPGLIECLVGEATLDEALIVDPDLRVTVLAAGVSSPNPTDLLASQQMRNLIAELKERFDLVILDTAPALAVSDSRILSRLADKTVFAVRWAKTRQETAAAGLRQILDANGDVAGVLLTIVDVREHARYGFTDSGYYHGDIKKYYTG